MDVSTILPIQSLSINQYNTVSEATEKISNTLGIDSSQISLFKLVPLTRLDAEDEKEEAIGGPVAVQISNSDLTMEVLERVLTENEQLKANLERTSQSLITLTQELQKYESEGALSSRSSSKDEKTTGKASALEKENNLLREKLQHSLSIRKESQQMLEVLRKEFALLSKRILKDPPNSARSTSSMDQGDTKYQDSPRNVKRTTLPAVPPPGLPSGLNLPRCQYTVELILDSVPAIEDSNVSFKLISADEASDNIVMPLPKILKVKASSLRKKPEMKVSFEVTCVRVSSIEEVWLWRDDRDDYFPAFIRHMIIRRAGSKEKFKFDCPLAAKVNSKNTCVVRAIKSKK